MANKTDYNRYRMSQRGIPETLFDQAVNAPTVRKPARDGRTFNVKHIEGTDYALVLVMGGPGDPDPVVTGHWSYFKPNSPKGWGWLDKAQQAKVGLLVRGII